MFGRGRFANRPYNVLTSQGFPFQLRNSYRIGLTRLDLFVGFHPTPPRALPRWPRVWRRDHCFSNQRLRRLNGYEHRVFVNRKTLIREISRLFHNSTKRRINDAHIGMDGLGLCGPFGLSRPSKRKVLRRWPRVEQTTCKAGLPQRLSTKTPVLGR